MMIDLEIEDLTRIFDDNYVTRGIKYANDGMVINPQVVESEDEGKIIATVRGSGNNVYQSLVSINYERRAIAGECSCPIGLNCKHVVAVLVDHLYNQDLLEVANEFEYPQLSQPERNSSIDSWLRTIKRNDESKINNESLDKLRFILSIENDWSGRYLAVKAVKTRRLKSGAWGKAYPKRPDSGSSGVYLTEDDSRIIDLLNATLGGMHHSGNHYKLNHSLSPYILEQLINSNKLHWELLINPEIIHAEPYQGVLDWQINGEVLDVVIIEQARMILLPTKPLFYFDEEKYSIGQLKTNLPDEQEEALSTAPTVPVEQALLVK